MSEFVYRPDDFEREKASNSYVMSLVAIMVGLPLPIVNLLATLIFYLGHRQSAYFVRWHCTQALLTQIALFGVNSVCFWWTVHILMGDAQVSNRYFAYLITVFSFNAFEFASTIYSAVQTRKGKHVHIWFFGGVTDIICSK